MIKRLFGETDTPNATMFAITPFVTKVDFAMLDDWVVPIGNIDGTVRAHPYVDRAERDMRRRNDFGLLLTTKSAALGRHVKSAYAVAAEIVGDQISTPIRGNVRPRQHRESTMFWASWVQSAHPPSRSRRRVKDGIRKRIVDAFEPRPIGDK